MGTRTLTRGLVAGALVTIAAMPAFAQAISTHRVPAALALEAVGAAVEACKAQGYAETAVVVDASGAQQAVLRGDGSGVHSIDSAYDKAYTASSFKTPSGALAERLLASPASA